MSVAGPADAGQAASPPTCFRHANRETYIRCVRCERPICPDCMIPASVGFMCPDDVKEGARSVRAPQTRFGGKVSDNPRQVSLVLIAVTVVLFVAQQVDPGVETGLRMLGGVMDPVSGQALLPGVSTGQWWRLLSAAFLHGSVLHIAFNMYAVWLFGPPLELAFGRLRFTTLYLTAALGGASASYAFNQPVTSSLGASGAVFGLFAAYLVLARRMRLDLSGLLVLLALNVGLGFLLPNIDWRAHAGGFLAGGVVAIAYVASPRARRRILHPLGVAAVVAASLGVVVGRTAELTGSGPGAVTACAVTAPLDAGSSFPACLSERRAVGS